MAKKAAVGTGTATPYWSMINSTTRHEERAAARLDHMVEAFRPWSNGDAEGARFAQPKALLSLVSSSFDHTVRASTT